MFTKPRGGGGGAVVVVVVVVVVVFVFVVVVVWSTGGLRVVYERSTRGLHEVYTSRRPRVDLV